MLQKTDGIVLLFKNLKKDIPELNISINVLSQEFRQAMKNNTVDIIFSSDYYRFDCEWLPLFEDPYYVAIPESYNFSDKVIDKENFASMKLFLNLGFTLNSRANQFFMANGILPEIQKRIQSDYSPS